MPSSLEWTYLTGTACWRRDDVIAKHFLAMSPSPEGGTPIQMFQREVDCLTAMQGHPNVPTVLSVNREQRVIYMEWCGPDLTYADAQLPTDWREQLLLLSHDLLDAGVRYADMKIENLCVRDRTLVLIDFGLAYMPGLHDGITPWIEAHARSDLTPLIRAVEAAR